MSDPDEIVEIFLKFPGDLSASQKADYERIYDERFEAHVPSPKKGGGLIKYGKDEWLALIKALVLGIEHFNFNGRVWKPLEYENPGIPGFPADMNPMEPAWDDEVSNGESFVNDGVHTGDGPQLLKLEGCDLKPTGKEVVWPVEWWTLTINAQAVPPKLVCLKFIKVLDASRCSTGGYSLVPVDLSDPNWWQLRTEIFRQIHEKTDDERKEIKRLIDRQVAELQQHMDYLSSIEQYADSDVQPPKVWDHRDKEELVMKLDEKHAHAQQ